MALSDKYRSYFDVDPEYYPSVNSRVIKNHPDLWKKFYPHKTFVDLVKRTVDLLERKIKRDIWVEGGYGTGKSHAVLTLKNLLDADDADTDAYFNRYGLDRDLCNRLNSVKRSGKILTVHRYGCSQIKNDFDLIFAVQESIENALREAGIENVGRVSFRNAAIAWLSDSHNKSYFDGLVTEEFSSLFGDDDADGVLEKLKTYDGAALEKLMDNIAQVGDIRHITPFIPSIKDLTDWIVDSIKENELGAIVFIWDEFTEYFRNNKNRLTGFQTLCELSETAPFFFILVTHVTQGLFGDSDPDYKKINDRFVNPHCIITLPENTAFQLMGNAMERKSDTEVRRNWDGIKANLSRRTGEPRRIVVKSVGNNINEKELEDILPIHPYAALLLKHISSAFASNQRSMFDFMKNSQDDKFKGFQWFIDNHGPLDDNPLLTVDMLWDFFYEKRDNLENDVRGVMDYYMRRECQELDDDCKRVLKAVLLLESISLHAGESIDLLIPNDTNLEHAFEGSDIDSATRYATQLVGKKILFTKRLRDGTNKYEIYDYSAGEDIEEYGKRIDKKTTTELITTSLTGNGNACVASALVPSGALALRYDMHYVSSSDFEDTVREVHRTGFNGGNKIVAVVGFGKDENECSEITSKMESAARDVSNEGIVFVGVSREPFGADYSDYRDYMARSMAYFKTNEGQSKQYNDDALKVLNRWRQRIEDGEFYIYTHDRPDGIREPDRRALFERFGEINKRRFPFCLESYNVIDDMYNARNLKQGVECGCTQETRNVFSSRNEGMKLENALDGAWGIEKYWEKNPELLISKIKMFVDDLAQDGFASSGRVSIRTIYEALKKTPYGFMPCNFSAFILGFVLKEYVGGTYTWSNGTLSDSLDLDKLKNMVEEVIKLDITPNSRYRENYIVAITREEKAFNAIASAVFGIQPNFCTSVPDTRERIRGKMKEFGFPFWTLKYVLEDEKPDTDKETLKKMIDLFCGIANDANIVGSASDSDIAMEIGDYSLKNPHAASDLKRIAGKDNCLKGMRIYLNAFNGGELVRLAEDIGDDGRYVSAVQKKFDADAACWVWDEETADRKIEEVILEYKIIAESNRVLPKCVTYEDALTGWVNKCDNIHVSYSAAEGYFGELKPLMRKLSELRRNGTIAENEKKDFLDALCDGAGRFNEFYNGQEDLFLTVCSSCLEGLTAEDERAIYDGVPSGVFTYAKDQFFRFVENKVADYRKNLAGEKLCRLWSEMTGTESPMAWSEKHMMPILFVVPDGEIVLARSAFDAINEKNRDGSVIDKAMDYIRSASFIDTLNNDEVLDEIFRNKMLKEYSAIFEDIRKVKDYLRETVADAPYYWNEHPEIDDRIRELASVEYASGGYMEEALAMVDGMSEPEAKEYLKSLIKDDMNIGIEVIKRV